jgi:hypothetical protein
MHNIIIKNTREALILKKQNLGISPSFTYVTAYKGDYTHLYEYNNQDTQYNRGILSTFIHIAQFRSYYLPLIKQRYSIRCSLIYHNMLMLSLDAPTPLVHICETNRNIL